MVIARFFQAGGGETGKHGDPGDSVEWDSGDPKADLFRDPCLRHFGGNCDAGACLPRKRRIP
jgi:hypothetical protein